MSVSPNSKKKLLATSAIYRSHIMSKEITFHKFAIWKISNFNKLKDNITYTFSYEEKRWKFFLMKKRKNFTVNVDFKSSNKNVKCCIITDKMETTFSVDATVNDKGLYEIKFNAKDYSGIDFLENKTLKLAFMYSSVALTDQIFPSICVDKNDVRQLSENLLHTFSSLMDFHSHHDFILRGKNYAIPVHKSILAVRSPFFAEHFKNFPDDKEIEISFEYQTIVDVLCFIYCGKLNLDENFKRTLDVLKSAVTLKIKSLKTAIQIYLLKIINQENVQHIRKFGLESGINLMENSIDKLLTLLD